MNEHQRMTGARLYDSASGAERKTAVGAALASDIGCASWGEGDVVPAGRESDRAQGRSHHVHDHDHGHAHSHGIDAATASRMPPRERAREKRSLLWTLAVTATIMVLEAVGGWLSGSLALQADAGHMLTDSSSLVLSILALSFASRPADLRRTYGYYRAEILAALANGAALLAVAALIFWEGIGR